MKARVLLLACALGSLMTTPAGSVEPKRDIPCKTPAIAASCYWTHGRLGVSNGNPSYRLWKIGTTRELGIFSGPSVDRFGLDSEGPELPANVERALHVGTDTPFGYRVFGDFEVCPLEPEKPQVMQAACIEAAKNLVVQK